MVASSARKNFARAGRALNVPGTLDGRAVLTLTLRGAATASGKVGRDVRAVVLVCGQASDAASGETLGAAGDLAVDERTLGTVMSVVAMVVATRGSERRGCGRNGRRRGRGRDTVAMVVAPLAAAAVAGVRAVGLILVVVAVGGNAGPDAVVPVPLARALVATGRDAVVVAVTTLGNTAALAGEPELARPAVGVGVATTVGHDRREDRGDEKKRSSDAGEDGHDFLVCAGL